MQVKITNATGATSTGEMTDVNPRGITLEYAGQSSPVYPLGESIWVVLSTKDERRPLKLAASCQRRWDEGTRRRYYFGFVASVDLSHLHTLGVVGMINQRQSFRVQPADGEILGATVFSPDEADKAKGTVADISEGGMGIVAPRFIEQKLASATMMKTAVTLPGGQTELVLVSNVLFRGISGDTLRYGLSFDPDQTPHFRAVQQRVAAYVMRRQREILAETRKKG